MSATAALQIVDDVDRTTSLLNPLRRRMLAELSEPESAAGIARRLGVPRQKANYHIRQLEEEGLVELVSERQNRGCTERLVRAVARSYVIDPAALGELASDPSKHRDRASSEYLVAVSAQTIRDISTLRARADEAEKRLPTLTVETEVRFTTPHAQRSFAKELTAELARLVAKYHDGEAPEGRSFRLVAGAYPKPRPETEPGSPTR